MTQPRHPKKPRDSRGRFMRLLPEWIGSRLRFRSDKDAPMLIEHDPKAQERNTTRSKK